MDLEKKLMIPDSVIPKCPEFEVKSKIGKIFKNQNPFEEYSVKIYEIDPYFYEHYEKKYKLIKMGVNIYHLELIFILVSVFQQQKLMKKDILTETLFLKKKDKKHQKKNLVVNLLELIQVMQKIVMIQIMRLVTYKYLLMSLKTDNQKKKSRKRKIRKTINQKNKRTRRQNKRKRVKNKQKNKRTRRQKEKLNNQPN